MQQAFYILELSSQGYELLSEFNTPVVLHFLKMDY